VSAVAILMVDLGARAVSARPGYLCWWGENALALYLLHLLLLGIIEFPALPQWYWDAPLWLAALQLAALLAVASVAASWLHRRRYPRYSTPV
jgi:fucose 4-O-acetylase-like acetyltransferase